MARLFFIISIIAFSAACTKDFLDKVPSGSLDLENFYTNPTEAEIGLIGAYSRIISKNMMDNIFWFMVSADEMTVGTSAIASGLGAGDHRAMLTPSPWGMLGTYTQPYVGIANINLLVEKVHNIPESSFTPGRKNSLLGEAYFLRGYAYYMLAMVFRDVPIQLEVPVSSDPNKNFMPKSSQSEVLNQALSDFERAIELMPDKIQGMSEHDIRGRGSKWAARAFKARILMWREKWNEAYQECREIVDGNQFRLTTRWTDIFSGENDNEEVIWQSQGQGRDKYDFIGVYRWYCDADYDKPLPPFMIEKGMSDIFAQPYKDVRLEYSARAIGRASGNSNYGGRNVKHFHVPTWIVNPGVSDESRDKNFPLIRLAEIELMTAEAIVQSGYVLGNKQEVLDILNSLRARAADTGFVPREPDSRYPSTGGGCKGINPLTLADINLQAVKDEKRRELMCEGVRWLDLLRWSRAEDNYQSVMAMVEAADTNRLYAAIPQQQINANKGVLVQNPGY